KAAPASVNARVWLPPHQNYAIICSVAPMLRVCPVASLGGHMELTPERVALSVPEAAQAAGLSKSAFWPLVMSGQVPSFQCGRRRLVPVESLRRWVEAQVATKPLRES